MRPDEQQLPGQSSQLLLCEAYRAALEINNAGVTLMKHGHFDGAIVTLKDSLFIMKYVLNEDSSTSNTNVSPHGDGQPQQQATSSSSFPLLGVGGGCILQEMLQGARTRLVQSQKQPLRHAFQIQPCDDGDVMAMKGALGTHVPSGPSLTSSFNTTTYVPIRLGSSFFHSLDSLCNNNNKEDIGKIPAAVILYNHALAHILAYHDHQDNTTTSTTAVVVEEQRQRYLHGAFVCLITSHSVLCQYRVVQLHATSLEILDAMLISALVLRQLFGVFVIKDQTQSANEAMQSLATLLEHAQLHQDALCAMNVYVENHVTARAA